MQKTVLLCISKCNCRCTGQGLPTLTIASKLQNMMEVSHFWNLPKKWKLWDKLIAVGHFQSTDRKIWRKKSGYDGGWVARRSWGGLCRVSWVGDGVVRGARWRGGEAPSHLHPPRCLRHQLLAALHQHFPRWLDGHRLAADQHHHGQDGVAAHGQQLLCDLVWEWGPRALQGLTPGLFHYLPAAQSQSDFLK